MGNNCCSSAPSSTDDSPRVHAAELKEWFASGDGGAQLRKVTVLCAKGLRDSDWLPGTGTCDPYVMCRIGPRGSSWHEKRRLSRGVEWRSRTIQDQQDPQWDLSFTFDAAGDWAVLALTGAADQEAGGTAEDLAPRVGLELHVRIYDQDLGPDDFLGYAIAPIPPTGVRATTAYPVVGKGAQGTVMVAFSKAEAGDSAVTNGTVSDPDEGGEHFWASLDPEVLLMSLSKWFAPSEGGTQPSFGYFLDMLKLKMNPYHETFYAVSRDGGATAPFPGPGATSILTHKEVQDELRTVPARQKSGEIWRGNDLGFIRLNHIFWNDTESKSIALGMPPEEHVWIRPILDEIVGKGSSMWSSAEVVKDAAAWLDLCQKSGKPFRVQADVMRWCQIYLHRVHFGMEISPELAERFVAFQNKLKVIVTLPGAALQKSLIAHALKIPDLLAFRKEMMDKYVAVLRAMPKHKERSDDDIQKLASACMDALAFAGGLSVPSIISCALAVVYGTKSPNTGIELTEQKIPALVWETLRFFPAVVGFPWYKTSDMKQRTILSLASALRDPRVWGEDWNEFRLRDLAAYHQRSCAWADLAEDSGIPAYNRSCPGKDLSLAMMVGFLSEFAKRKHNWTMSEEARGKITFKGATPFISNFEFQPAQG